VDRRDRSGYERVAAAVVAKALRGDLEAARWLADRVDGRVPQSVDVSQSHTVSVVPWLPAIAQGAGAVDGAPFGDDVPVLVDGADGVVSEEECPTPD